MKVIGYVRVSTTKQVQFGLSLEAQQQKIRQYCELYDLDLVQIIVDGGESAGTLNRKGIQEVIDLLESNEVSGLIVTKLDRLTRSIKDLHYLLENLFKKASLFSVSELIDTRSPSGRLVLNILTSVSQWERETISERVKESLRSKRSNGEYTGGKTPLGWKLDEQGNEVPDNEEQELIDVVRGLRSYDLTYELIARKLTESKAKTRTGNTKFSKSSVKRLNDAETIEERAKRLGS